MLARKNFTLALALALGALGLATSASAWDIYLLEEGTWSDVESGPAFVADFQTNFGTSDPELEIVGIRPNPRDDGFRLFGQDVRYEKAREFDLGGVSIRTYFKAVRADDSEIHAFAIDGEEMDWLVAAAKARKAAVERGCNEPAIDLVVHFAARVMHVEDTDLCDDVADVATGGLFGLPDPIGAGIEARRALCRAGEEAAVTRLAVEQLLDVFENRGELEIDATRGRWSTYHAMAPLALSRLAETDTSLTDNQERATDLRERAVDALDQTWMRYCMS